MLEIAAQVISCEVKKSMFKALKILWFLVQKKETISMIVGSTKAKQCVGWFILFYFQYQDL